LRTLNSYKLFDNNLMQLKTSPWWHFEEIDIVFWCYDHLDHACAKRNKKENDKKFSHFIFLGSILYRTQNLRIFFWKNYLILHQNTISISSKCHQGLVFSCIKLLSKSLYEFKVLKFYIRYIDSFEFLIGNFSV
jgi:hypothetical protein